MIYGPPFFLSGSLAALVIFFALVMGGPEQAVPTEPIVVTIPEGLTAHLENPQIMIDRTGTLFASTRPNSGVGSFVWMVKDGQTSMVLDLGPDKSYALGEFFIDQRDNRLYFVTVEKDDHTKLVAYPIAQWTP